MKIPIELADRLANASSIAVLTGAGVSAESGVPTFREAQTGLWENYRAEDLATPEAFLRDPKMVWDWYAWRRKLVADTHPNPAHHALVVLEKRVSTFTLITQNVDGLHQRAGSRAVLELHGNIVRSKCFDEGTVFEKWDEEGEVPPTCPRCGAHLRPDVVWFGESLPAETLQSAIAASSNCEVFLSVGTSTLVYPAADLPFQAARSGATVVEINPDQTPLSDQADFVLAAPAGRALPELVATVWV